MNTTNIYAAELLLKSVVESEKAFPQASLIYKHVAKKVFESFQQTALKCEFVSEDIFKAMQTEAFNRKTGFKIRLNSGIKQIGITKPANGTSLGAKDPALFTIEHAAPRAAAYARIKALLETCLLYTSPSPRD